MKTRVISASSYSNTAPLIWSFLYGANRGKHEIILDTAPARSAELLATDQVDAALVPVIAYQLIDGAKLIPDVCVGAKERVESVCLVTKGKDLRDVRSVSLDISSKTSVALTKIIFREFLGFEPAWKPARPDLDEMLDESDCALLIGDPALGIKSESTFDRSGSAARKRGAEIQDLNEIDHGRIGRCEFRKFDLVELWREFTGFGFVFAMWMTVRETCDIDFAAARDEGVSHIEDIITNYENDISLSHRDFKKYLTENISYSISESMQHGMDLYFELAAKNGLINRNRPLTYLT
ncbi:MAG: menaquinone biosynthesis protein [Acidobacteria bacterium]|nr:menaquinone biosynthesis protein [Acidobacteriota bacterium]